MLALQTDLDFQNNILKFGYSINYKYGQLSHSIDRYNAVTKFQVPRLIDIPMIFRKMPVDYNNCDYSYPCNSTKLFICGKVFEMAKYNIYVTRPCF